MERKGIQGDSPLPRVIQAFQGVSLRDIGSVCTCQLTSGARFSTTNLFSVRFGRENRVLGLNVSERNLKGMTLPCDVHHHEQIQSTS
jgi:hypothetical protein